MVLPGLAELSYFCRSSAIENLDEFLHNVFLRKIVEKAINISLCSKNRHHAHLNDHLLSVKFQTF